MLKLISHLFFLVFLVIITNTAYSQSNIQNNYDVKFYHITVTANTTSTFLTADTKIGFVINSQSDSVVLDFGSQMKITALWINGKSSEYYHRKNQLIVYSNFTKDKSYTIEISYKGDGAYPNGEEAVRLKEYLPYGFYFYTLTEPYSSKYWFPCKEVLTDKADSVFVDILIPDNLKAGSVGLLTDVVETDTGWVQYQWKSYYPTSFYLISIAFGDYLDYTFQYNNEQDTFPVVNLIYNSEEFLQEEKDRIDTTSCLLDIFTDLYGPYPFREEKYGHCLVPAGGGMEHQTMTTLGNFSFNLVAHEMAHQWFGDYVTCSTWNDIWINEGFASYSEYLVYEYLGDTEAAFSWIGYAHELAMTSARGSIYVPDSVVDDESRVFNYNLTYKKGASILHMLRYEINNDELFFGALKSYLKKFEFGTASAKDFQQQLESFCDIDLESFFEQWYYGSGYPIYSFKWYQEDGEFVIICNQKGSDPENTAFFKQTLPVLLTFPQGDTLIKIPINEPETKWTVSVDQPVYYVTIDPEDVSLEDVNSVSRNDSLSSVTLKNILIYPNPAKNSIRIYSNIQYKTISLSFHNTDGRLVKSIKDIVPDGSEHNIADLQPGLYLVSVDFGDQHGTLKLIKS